jgi:hypothetical protein
LIHNIGHVITNTDPEILRKVAWKTVIVADFNLPEKGVAHFRHSK